MYASLVNYTGDRLDRESEIVHVNIRAPPLDRSCKWISWVSITLLYIRLQLNTDDPSLKW